MVEVTTDQCDHCGSTNLEECGIEKQVIEEIPPPPKIEVIQFNVTSINAVTAVMSSPQRTRNALKRVDSA